jgi:hypothetical protein
MMPGCFVTSLLLMASCCAAAVSARGFYAAKNLTSGRPPMNAPAAAAKSSSAAVAAKATAQYLDCFDYNNQGGERFRAVDYVPTLYTYNFDNRISSCCFTGIWLIYADDYYNENNVGAANWWAYGNNMCTNVPTGFDNAASSLRFTGAPDGWEYDVLNLYFNDFFIGGEEFLYNDAAQLNYDDRARSVIVTGCSPWTLYQYNNYQGNRICVWPANTAACYPGFYTTAQSLGALAGQVSSARKGCFAKESRLPDNHMAEGRAVEGGASGFFPARIAAPHN